MSESQLVNQAEARVCIGFEQHEGICDRPAGTPWTPLWCDRCDAERRAKLTQQFEDIRNQMEAKR